MDEKKSLADQFEANRAHLRAVAFRILGSGSEAEDAVQEAWLRLNRTDIGDVDNLGAWLRTVVARICLDMLRSRKLRREDPMGESESDLPSESGTASYDPEYQLALADSVGLAMLVVLETLGPAERVAFVLHDMFDLPFDDIAPIVGRTTDATRKLASRARQRVQGTPISPEADRARQRRVIEAFLAASRDGDFEALLSILDPEVVFRADEAATRLGSEAELRGPEAVAIHFKGRARGAKPATLDGALGVLVESHGKTLLVLRVTLKGDRIIGIDAVADAESLAGLQVNVLD
ncbi:sigma-70 family RNA polymerase sigma factor [Mesorhizobium retamae]|uniref:Sigma-70 family RNA polymerase sigma factor n=1 Tax=Mesorhizobium retamae TaxID=2912854 RepID=A0ABS9QHV3_9HYPH|nr:sigma-70 family RNA polymerase sigma factor [Mesorhizobium sp. IRAMC:0171]MCG7506940.1 sigma-70 family RNA polymerase sigma factor [Mesorhizobium sp. IRAMC:0171]